MSYCPNCGTQNTDTAKYCINCGAALTLVADSGKTATQTVVSSQPRVAIKKRTRPILTINRSTPIISHLGLWGSLAIIAGFFLSWINPAYGEGITGLRIVTEANKVVNEYDPDKIGLLILITVLAINLSAIICFFYIIGVPLGRPVFTFFKILPLLILVGVVGYVIVKAQQSEGIRDGFFGPGAFKGIISWIGIGLYLTLAGSFLLAISKSRR